MKRLNKSRLHLVEIENLFEQYTGRRKGYRYKFEYVLNIQEKSIQKTSITCLEVSPKSTEINIEARVNIPSGGQVEVEKFISKNSVELGLKSHRDFAQELFLKVYKRIEG